MIEESYNLITQDHVNDITLAIVNKITFSTSLYPSDHLKTTLLESYGYLGVTGKDRNP